MFASVGLVLFILSLFFIFWTESAILIFGSILMLLLFLPIGYYFFGNKKKIRIKIFKKPNFKNSKKSLKTNKLDKVTQQTNDKLFEITSVFPFDLFPNKVIIGQKQIVLVYRQFFFASQVYNFLIQDILTPVVGSSVFFSTLRIELGPGGFQQNPPSIKYLRKKEALKARRIIMGLIICEREKVDLVGIPPGELVLKVEEIGRMRGG